MAGKITRSVWFCFLLVGFISIHAGAQNEDVLKKTIKLEGNNGSIYSLLGQISEQTGYLFMYDSNLIHNESVVNIKAGEYPVGEAINHVLQDLNIAIRVLGRNIVLYLPEVAETTPPPYPVLSVEPEEIPKDTFFTISGSVFDQLTEEPIPYVSLGLLRTTIGTVTNMNGEFRLRVSASYQDSTLYFSHIGYEAQQLRIDSLSADPLPVYLPPRVIPIQEVVVRRINPLRLLQDMLKKKEENYSTRPVYHTVFYREGVEYKKRFVSLTETVMKVFKTPATNSSDQVKLLKMRRVMNEQERDTLVTRFKSGVDACLMLDLIKHLPDFLEVNEENPYVYTYSDITTFNDELAHVLSFEQKQAVPGPYYRGEIYISMESDALLGAQFEINPEYVNDVTNLYITKKSRKLSFSTQKIAYTVSYMPWEGKYYINHIRGDLHFKVKKRRHLFNNAPIHIWFEMVNCKTEFENVVRFPRNESLPTRTILSETAFNFDADFWEDFNIILPEEELHDAIRKITTKIEETGY